MNAILAQLLRSRWLAAILHGSVWLILLLALLGLRGNAPAYREADASAPPPQIPSPVGKLDRLFNPGAWPRILEPTNGITAFYTKHFIPPPTVAPPPPTTKKIELSYQGFFFTENGAKRTMVKMGDKYIVATEGSNLVANLYVAKVSVLSLLLTNSAGKTNLLALDKKAEVEVPIK